MYYYVNLLLNEHFEKIKNWKSILIVKNLLKFGGREINKVDELK